jgi:hypothetical protein
MPSSKSKSDSLDAAVLPEAAAASSNELVMLIRKLRWMGMEEQAEALQRELGARSAGASDCVVARSAETD